VIVEIGGSARSRAFAVNRGEATAKLEKSAKARPASPRVAKAPSAPKRPRAKPKSLEDAVAFARREILERLAASSAPWLAKAQLCGTSAPAKAAYEQLVEDGSIVELGKLGKLDVVTRGRGQAAVDVLRELAVEIIVTRGTRDALTALPIEPSDPFWKGSLRALLAQRSLLETRQLSEQWILEHARASLR
jgi:hypothetical protein